MRGFPIVGLLLAFWMEVRILEATVSVKVRT